MNIRTKRVYQKPADEDVYRLLVDQWQAFKDRYIRELSANRAVTEELGRIFLYVNKGTVTLL